MTKRSRRSRFNDVALAQVTHEQFRSIRTGAGKGNVVNVGAAYGDFAVRQYAPEKEWITKYRLEALRYEVRRESILETSGALFEIKKFV